VLRVFLLPLVASQIDFAVLIYSLSNDAGAVAKIFSSNLFHLPAQKMNAISLFAGLDISAN
jgi:hypothetical protein